MAPIYETIENKPKLLIWNETLQPAFQNAKCALASAAHATSSQTPSTFNTHC